MNDLDIVLVRPWAPSAAPPGSLVEDALGVGYLAAALRNAGYSVAVLDAFTFEFNDEQLVECIGRLAPRAIGVSLHSFADYRHTIAICSAIAERHPEIYRIVGGEHATFLAREILERHECVDAVVQGEGEATIVELVASRNSDRPFEPTPGAFCRAADGTIVDGGARTPISDLDSLPFPSKDIVETAIQSGKSVAVSLLTGRGCTHKCTFCTANTYLRMGEGSVWRRRRPERVADELEALVLRYIGHPPVHPMVQFQDVIFLGTSPTARAWARSFVEELEARGLRVPYYFMSRAEAILANEDLFPRLVATGLASVEVGIESGVDRILQSYAKQNSVARTEAAIRVLQKHGVCYDASGFIMFDPHITLDELRVNARFLRHLGHATWDRYVTKLQVFPGTALRPQLIAEGLFRADAALDDVYAYEYQDPRVAEIAARVLMYDAGIRTLDTQIHNARYAIGQRTRPAEATDALRGMTNVAEDMYCDFFLSLLDFADQRTLVAEFGSHLCTFLVRVRDMNERLMVLTDVDSERGVPSAPVSVNRRGSDGFEASG
ncbi:MAG: B12-binding domain-containing radical SAM protein [Actinomycetota bacterium]|nr:B12-binding domain-containing radical SAM protein [Actinomycetota bacterium]